jgi:thiamine transporter ThiT
MLCEIHIVSSINATLDPQLSLPVKSLVYIIMETNRVVNCPQTLLDYVVPNEENSIAHFFKSTPAKNWTASKYITAYLNKYETHTTNC